MIIGINHVQITIPEGNEGEAKKFYCEFLGLKEIEKPKELRLNGGFWMQIGSIQVHVGIENGIDRKKNKTHIAYEVHGIELWKIKLCKKNIAIEIPRKIQGYNRLEFRDPFGNRVEFIERES